jgi:hypothetical protein
MIVAVENTRSLYACGTVEAVAERRVPTHDGYGARSVSAESIGAAVIDKDDFRTRSPDPRAPCSSADTALRVSDPRRGACPAWRLSMFLITG